MADNQAHAQRAAKAVKIQYEELEPIITIEVSSPQYCSILISEHKWKFSEHERSSSILI